MANRWENNHPKVIHFH